MILGSVNAGREAVIPVVVLGTDDRRQSIEAVIDTGFTAELSLPAVVIESLGLTWSGRELAMLADGNIRRFDYYQAAVEWDGSPRRVKVFAAESEPLIGMALLEGYELTIQAVAGGAVTITELTRANGTNGSGRA